MKVSGCPFLPEWELTGRSRVLWHVTREDVRVFHPKVFPRSGLLVFQTYPHLPARTDDLLVSATIRGLRGVDLARAFGSGRIASHDSVRVEFESTRAVRKDWICRNR